MENKRIFICGPSGTGKTTLAEWISKTYRIPFVSTSGKVLWEKYNIKSHAELIDKCASDVEFAMRYQYELLNYRHEALLQYDNFVTDRSPIDNLVYYLMQVASNASPSETETYVLNCEEAMKRGNKIIYSPFNKNVVLEDDNMRIANPHYQSYTSAVFDYVLEKNLLSLHEKYTQDDILNLNEWDWNIRMNRVKWLLTEPSLLQKTIKKWLRRN